MAEKQTFILGLIGGVGAGKSTVLTLLEDHYGFYVIQTDLTARRLLEPGEAAFEEIAALFGRDILRPDGRIDRARLAEQIFQDPQKRKQVNAITHPLTWNAVLTAAYSCGNERVVIETALPSKEFRDICDEMWYLYTSREERIRRLKESRGYSDEKIAGIMANQASEEEFRNFIDCEINNSGTEEETSLQIQKLLCGKDNETA